LLKESCIIHGNQSTSNMSWDIPHFILIIIIKSNCTRKDDDYARILEESSF
jgi:hypothetical protein